MFICICIWSHAFSASVRQKSVCCDSLCAFVSLFLNISHRLHCIAHLSECTIYPPIAEHVPKSEFKDAVCLCFS